MSLNLAHPSESVKQKQTGYRQQKGQHKSKSINPGFVQTTHRVVLHENPGAQNARSDLKRRKGKKGDPENTVHTVNILFVLDQFQFM